MKLAKRILAPIDFSEYSRDAFDVAVDLASHNRAELVVIATHGMTGWRRIPFGSVAEKVVKHADCAVLVLRAEPEPP